MVGTSVLAYARRVSSNALVYADEGYIGDSAYQKEYTNRNTAVTVKFFVRMDVTEEFPFLVTKMSPYYDR